MIKFLNSCNSLFINKGDEVYEKGYPSQFVYFVLKGRVATYCLDEKNKLKV